MSEAVVGNGNMKTILVVGDWMVDDYWIAGTHQSRTASRVGRTHYRALNRPDSNVQSLGGAGRVASVLSDAGYRLFGLGMWHPADTDHLTAMLERKNVSGWTPCRIARSSQYQPANVKLASLAVPHSQLDRSISMDDAEHYKSYGTARVLRLNQSKGDTPQLLGRLDWDAVPTAWENDDRVWVGKDNHESFRDIIETKLNEGNRWPDISAVDTIIIKDMYRGVVSDALIQILADRYCNASWYVSSKRFVPTWLERIPENKLKLYMIPEVAAQEAVELGLVSKWFSDQPGAKSGMPAPEALKLLETLPTTIYDTTKPVLSLQRNAVFVVLPHEYRVLARHSGDGFVQPDLGKAPYYEHSAMNSVFFPTLIHQLLEINTSSQGSPSKEELATAIHLSLEYSYLYNQADRKWIESKGDKKELPQTLSAFLENWPECKINSTFRDSDIKTIAIQDKLKDWKAAHNAPCIITNTKDGISEHYIELWRSMIEVEGYVCCAQENRNVIARMVRDLTPFANARPHHNQSGMVVAMPGSGKSTLVKQLAYSLKLEPLQYNISQMLTRKELVTAFDEIMTTQARDFRRSVLVFVDEINARIQDQYVFDMFLAPLQDNVFIRDGRKYPIGPCIWLFAGTQLPSKCQGAEDPSRKAADFETRWTLGTYDLACEVDKRNQGMAEASRKAENIYRVILMIRRNHPGVYQFAKSFIEFVANLPAGITPRDLEHLANRLVDVRHGEITLRNLSDDAKKKWGVSANSTDNANPQWIQVR